VATAAKISEFMRDTAYRASSELAKERGAFPLFNADLYLSGSSFAARLPAELKAQIRKNGIRNSHLLSIAPTGTISLAFADNASNGMSRPSPGPTREEAHGRRDAEGIPGRGLRLAPLQAWRRGRERAASVLRHRARDLGLRAREDWSTSPCAGSSHG